MEGLSIDNILGAEEIDTLFTDNEESQEETQKEEETVIDPEEKKEEKTTEVNADNLFAEPEGVGSEDNIEVQEETPSKKDSTSPNSNIYSSFAGFLAEEGVFPDLDKDKIKDVTKPEDIVELMNNCISAGIDERNKRIDEALNAGMEPSEVNRYEATLKYLDSLDDDTINDEGEKGETLRKQLIFQDYINRGLSKERAQREVEKSFNGGTDIEDAKEALKGNKEYFRGEYDSIVKEAKKEQERIVEERKKKSEELKKSILSDKKVFGDLDIDKTTRQKVVDNITKATYKDPETGEYMTALQKYQMENSTEFLKNLGLVFTLTDGFKNFDRLVRGKVNKEMKKGLRELENTLNNTARNSDGSLRFVSGVDSDSDSYIGKGFTLDL